MEFSSVVFFGIGRLSVGGNYVVTGIRLAIQLGEVPGSSTQELLVRVRLSISRQQYSCATSEHK